MREYLNIISDTINDLNKEKERIESKTTKTQADVEEIKAIEELYQNLATRLEGWLTTKKQNQPSYQSREEVYVFEDSTPKDTFKELDNLITREIDEEKKARQLAEIDRLIDEEIAEFDTKEKTNEFAILNESIYEGMKEEKQSDELNDKVKEVNNLIDAGMSEKDNKESNDTSVVEEIKEENVEEELGAMLRQFFENEAEEKKEKPLRNFVTKIKKRISSPKKINKQNIVSGMKNFCKKCVPSFLRKKETDMNPEEQSKEQELAKEIILEYESDINNYGQSLPIQTMDGYLQRMLTKETILENENNENDYEKSLSLESMDGYLEDELHDDFEEETSLGIIGSTASIYEGTRVHNNAFDAYMGKNSYPTYYGDNEERVVIGVAIVNDTGIQAIYANEDDYKEKIDSLLANGGDVVSVLTANKKYLSDWDGKTPLLWAEIQAYKEGWYNINDISNKSMKGLSR